MKHLLNLGLRNLLRNRIRTAITLGAIVFGVCALLFLIWISLEGGLLTRLVIAGLPEALREQPPAQLALHFACDTAQAGVAPLAPGGVTFGGERRLSFLRPSQAALPASPEPLAQLFAAVPRRARVVLLTPGLFADGFAPAWIGDERVRVVAAAVPRAQIVSGWDFAAGGPKASRRMAAAGSVYWVELPADLDAAAWLAKVWMKCIPNPKNPQDSRDGFGLCAVGVG